MGAVTDVNKTDDISVATPPAGEANTGSKNATNIRCTTLAKQGDYHTNSFLFVLRSK